MNVIMQTLMRNLMNKNPNGYQMINQLMNNGTNPEEMLQQMFSNASPEQKQKVLNAAKSYGCPSNILSKFQNLK